MVSFVVEQGNKKQNGSLLCVVLSETLLATGKSLGFIAHLLTPRTEIEPDTTEAARISLDTSTAVRREVMPYVTMHVSSHRSILTCPCRRTHVYCYCVFIGASITTVDERAPNSMLHTTLRFRLCH